MSRKTFPEISEAIRTFAPIGLEEMNAVTLMDRTDVKYTVPVDQLPALLASAREHYRILEIGGKRILSYETLYYDTPDLDLYRKHHAGQLNRHKIRFRTYVDSSLSFLEVKFKNNKGRTVKTRIESNSDSRRNWDVRSRSFLEKNTALPDPAVLRPVLWINYDRLTLVGTDSKERITIDLNLTFVEGERQERHDHLAVIEVKQEKQNASSEFRDLLRRERIKPGGISKYCFGVATMRRDVKSNHFKQKIRYFKKLKIATTTVS